MTFIQLFRKEMHGSLPRLVFMAALGGISNAALLAALNAGAQATGKSDKPSLWAAGLFLVSLFLFIKTQHYILITATVEIESIIHKLRVRLMDKLRQSELVPMERIGRGRIVGAITGDTAVLTQASTVVVFSVQSLVLVILVGVYVAYLSIAAFLLSMAVVGGAGAIFHAQGRRHAEGLREASEGSVKLFDRLTDFLDGFKEVRLNKLRSDNLYDDACEVSSNAAYIKIRTDAEGFKRMIFSQSAMYLVLASVVFVAPNFGSMGEGSASKAITSLLFVVGACFGLVQTIPMLRAADGAADRISQLETELSATAQSVEISPDKLPKRFDKIEMSNIVFRHFDMASEALFKIGPIDFTLRSGDLVFITGGNGSGKSTFLKVLAGLYLPESGEILLDGKRINDNTREEYRGLITAIFTDYHLFRRLYGITDSDTADVDRLLEKYRLSEKTRITNGEFQNIHLSGGQRKRLALIVALLEKRPILLLDEWTSDQDPDFRRKFYHEILPELNQTGATIVVITHDDRYLNELDLPARRIHMEEGHFD
jgi:putative ATP-binding cassette transporter